jgi:hypothetical protein
MKLKSTIMTVVILLAAGIVFIAACSSEQPEEPSPTATLKATSGTPETIDAMSTDAPGDGTGAGSDEDVDVFVPTRTPVPTITPGVVDDVVESFTEAVGLENFYFLGLYATDWINLASRSYLLFSSTTWVDGSSNHFCEGLLNARQQILMTVSSQL